MLKEAKRTTISEKIYACNRNTKQLYKLVSELRSSNKENPLSIGKSNNDLAEEFADFFLSKIQQIHDSLEGYETFSPLQHHSASKLSSFMSLMESDVATIIRGMASKSCEVDPIPTTLLKDILSSVIKPITTVINISLQHGIFASAWKVEVIKPLLERVGLDLIPQTYCPVSNLPFLNKVLEHCVLNQFDQHCSKYSPMPGYQSAYRKISAVRQPLLR